MSILGVMVVCAEERNGAWGIARSFIDLINKGGATQDAAQVQHLLEVIFSVIPKLFPDARTVTIQSDNAPAFAASGHVQFLHRLNQRNQTVNGITVREWVFSESQMGKSELDGHFSFVQRSLKRWIQEPRHKVLTCDDIFEALCDQGGISGTTNVLVDFYKAPKIIHASSSIQGISLVHSITFSDKDEKEGKVMLRRFCGMDEEAISFPSAKFDGELAAAKIAYTFARGAKPSRWMSDADLVEPVQVANYPESKPSSVTTRAHVLEAACSSVAVVSGFATPTASNTNLACSVDFSSNWAKKYLRPATHGLSAHVTSLVREQEDRGPKADRIMPPEALAAVLPSVTSYNDRLLLSVSRVTAIMRQAFEKGKKSVPAPENPNTDAPSGGRKGRKVKAAITKVTNEPDGEEREEDNEDIDVSLLESQLMQDLLEELDVDRQVG
jgi:hypothetical protein